MITSPAELSLFLDFVDTGREMSEEYANDILCIIYSSEPGEQANWDDDDDDYSDYETTLSHVVDHEQQMTPHWY